MLRKRGYITEQKIEKMIDEISVFFVDGEDVRNEKDVEFTLGGHHFRYDFIPEKEIWVEKTKPENRGGGSLFGLSLISRAFFAKVSWIRL